MNAIVKSALIGAIKALLGSEWWEQVRKAIDGLADVDIPGTEKRAMAFTALREAGFGMASWFLNLAIEIAVAVLMAELGKEGDK